MMDSNPIFFDTNVLVGAWSGKPAVVGFIEKDVDEALSNQADQPAIEYVTQNNQGGAMHYINAI